MDGKNLFISGRPQVDPWCFNFTGQPFTTKPHLLNVAFLFRVGTVNPLAAYLSLNTFVKTFSFALNLG